MFWSFCSASILEGGALGGVPLTNRFSVLPPDRQTECLREDLRTHSLTGRFPAAVEEGPQTKQVPRRRPRPETLAHCTVGKIATFSLLYLVLFLLTAL